MAVTISLNVKLGGGERIRTSDPLSEIPALQAGALDHYATPPEFLRF